MAMLVSLNKLFVTTQLEAILNSRFLSAVYNDPNVLECVAPGYFLNGSVITVYSERDISDVPENRLTFWKRSPQMVAITYCKQR